MLHDLIVSLYGENTYRVLAVIFKLYPIWLPFLTGIIFWEFWVRYVRYLFFVKTETTLIEVRIPREISKSPLAMELVLLSLHQLGGESTVIARYWEGKVRAWFSLELVSDGGEVRFYIWTRKNMRDIIESQLYAQYPNIEVTEVADYTKNITYKPGENDMWGAHYVYLKPDAYPIRSYTEFGLDKDPKEEYKNDPLTTTLEFMGSIKPGEQVWLQYITRAHKSEKRGGFFSPKEDWRKAADKERQALLDKIKAAGRLATPGENEIIQSIERSLGKYPFDVGIRVMYVAVEKDKFSNTTVTGLRGLLRAFGSQNLNSFKDDGTDFDYPWQDYRNIRLDRMKRKMLDAYKRRMYFFYPYKYKPLVMTNEELATMYHFPGEVASTPGIPRIQSKRAQAPSNLPV
ncbi:MAG: protein of unknown function with transrane region [Candidatus Paceibacter sp.]|jgi:hypothetical protein|nr:protein of unknown function with transrane region [Candidatus Paceibacter sp.]